MENLYMLHKECDELIPAPHILLSTIGNMSESNIATPDQTDTPRSAQSRTADIDGSDHIDGVRRTVRLAPAIAGYSHTDRQWSEKAQ